MNDMQKLAFEIGRQIELEKLANKDHSRAAWDKIQGRIDKIKSTHGKKGVTGDPSYQNVINKLRGQQKDFPLYKRFIYGYGDKIKSKVKDIGSGVRDWKPKGGWTREKLWKGMLAGGLVGLAGTAAVTKYYNNKNKSSESQQGASAARAGLVSTISTMLPGYGSYSAPVLGGAVHEDVKNPKKQVGASAGGLLGALPGTGLAFSGITSNIRSKGRSGFKRLIVSTPVTGIGSAIGAAIGHGPDDKKSLKKKASVQSQALVRVLNKSKNTGNKKKAILAAGGGLALTGGGAYAYNKKKLEKTSFLAGSFNATKNALKPHQKKLPGTSGPSTISNTLANKPNLNKLGIK